MEFHIGLLIVLLCFSFVDCRSNSKLKPLVPSESYTHNLVVDEDNRDQLQLFWKLLDNDEIQFEVHCKSTGWVGVGISPNGGMTGSDIALGWVKNNKAYLKDCYAVGKSKPVIDVEQNLDLIDGIEMDGYTVLKFKRKLLSCDESYDIDIKIGTQYMIFAWNDNDPETGLNDWQYHGSNRFPRATVLLNFKNESVEEQNNLPSDTFKHDLRMNVRIPKKDTYYFCEVLEVPKFDKPAHLIQFEMLVNPKNKKYVHHVLGYECESDYVYEPFANECGSVPLPSYVSFKCFSKLFIAWGVGGQYNYSFPKQAGYRFEPTTKPKYILLEMHYDNPELKDDIVDDSGLRLYFTEQLREHDLGLLTLGTEGNFISLQIPPKTSNWAYTSICYPQCTEKYFPEDGIYAISGLLHTHLAGRSVKTTLVRNGIERPLFDNPKYDFNYQFAIDIEPFKLQKGDALITTCRYETNDRNKFTFFGFGTYDEMCYDFFYYYPKQSAIERCMTVMPARVLKEFYVSLEKDGLIPPIPGLDQTDNPFAIQFSIIDFFQNNVTYSPQLNKRFETFYASEYNKDVFCGDPFAEFTYEFDVENFKANASETTEVKKCSNGASVYFISILLLFLSIFICLF